MIVSGSALSKKLEHQEDFYRATGNNVRVCREPQRGGDQQDRAAGYGPDNGAVEIGYEAAGPGAGVQMDDFDRSQRGLKRSQEYVKLTQAEGS